MKRKAKFAEHWSFCFLVFFALSRHFAHAAAGDENWDRSFGVPGAKGFVWPMAVVGDKLYVGGSFTQIGGVDATSIAQWDGTKWNPLGLGTDGEVDALVASATDLFVSGGFNSAGGIPATHIAKWDGTNWSALGTGLGGYAYALAAAGNKLFAGGIFTSAGGIAATNIAMWDGSCWTNLGNGINGQVNTLAADGTNLYVGGIFYQRWLRCGQICRQVGRQRVVGHGSNRSASRRDSAEGFRSFFGASFRFGSYSRQDPPLGEQ